MIDGVLARLRTSWELARACLRTVAHHRRLLLFPVLLLLTAVLAFGAFVGWPLLGSSGDPDDSFGLWLVRDAPPWLAGALILAQGLLLPYLGYVVATFFNVAQVHASLRALRGDTVSVTGAFRYALSRLGSTLAWSGLAILVGTLLAWPRAVSRSASRVLPAIASVSWSVLALVAMPVLVQERRGALDSLRRAAALLRRQMDGSSPLALIGLGVLWLPVLALQAAVIWSLSSGASGVTAEQSLVAVLAMAGFSLLIVVATGFLNGVYGAAVYVFAVEGVVPGDFDVPELDTVWSVAPAAARTALESPGAALPLARAATPPSRRRPLVVAAVVAAAVGGVVVTALSFRPIIPLLFPEPGVSVDPLHFPVRLAPVWELELPGSSDALVAADGELLVATSGAVFVVDARGERRASVPHDVRSPESVAKVRAGAAGAAYVVGGFHQVAAFDADGRRLWTHLPRGRGMKARVLGLRAPGGEGDLVAVRWSFGDLCVLAAADGVERWCRSTGLAVGEAFASLDCDGDGTEEIVTITPNLHPFFGRKLACRSARGGVVRQIDLPGSELIPPMSLAAGDVDGDGTAELVTWRMTGLGGPDALGAVGLDGRSLYELRLEGDRLDSVAAHIGAVRLRAGEPAHLVAGLWDGRVVGTSTNGERWGLTLPGARGDTHVAALDVDGDGAQELITSSDGLLTAWRWHGTAPLPAPDPAELLERARLIVEEPTDWSRRWRAKAFLEQVTAGDPQNARAHALLAVLWALEGEDGAAASAASIAKARALAPEDVEVRRAEARLDHAADEHQRAADRMAELVAGHPGCAACLRDLGHYAAQLHRSRRAEAAFAKALALAPDGDEAYRVHFLAGEMYADAGLADRAAGSYEAALDERSGSALAWTRLAGARVRCGRCEEAAGAASRALELNPGSWEAERNLLEARMCTGTLDEDDPLVESAGGHRLVSIGDYYRDRGELETARRFYDEAQAAFEKLAEYGSASSRASRDRQLRFARSELALRSGDAAGAWRELEPIFTEDSESSALLSLAARVQLGRGSRREALRLAARSLEARPSSERELAAAFGEDPEYRALQARTASRIEELYAWFEQEYDYQHLRRDPPTQRWIFHRAGFSDENPGSIPHLRRFLAESPFPETRARAGDALSKAGRQRVVPELIAALDDPSPYVGSVLAVGLGMIGDPAAVVPLTRVLDRMQGDADDGMTRVAEALGRLGDPRAIHALEASIERVDDVDYRRVAREAVAKLQARP